MQGDPAMLRASRSTPLSKFKPYNGPLDLSTSRRRGRYQIHRFRLPSIRALITAALLAVFVLLWFLYRWEVHVEIMFYPRSWVKQQVIDVPPLGGCFSSTRLARDGVYNVTKAHAPKYFDVQAGIQMRLGMDCYDFAGTITLPASSTPRIPLPRSERTNFHTYWRADLVAFGPRQEWMLKSFFATQDLSSSTLIMWSNGQLEKNAYVARYLQKYPEAFEVRRVDIPEMAKDTPLENSPRLHSTDTKAWVDGDLVRLLVIWAHGGAWVDMDSLLTRDLRPLLEHEFVTQWDCYDKIYQPMNGALMHFHQHSPYLCEAFHIMATSPPPRSGSTDWGSLLYYKVWRRLIAASIPPFKILPFCFSDGRSCRMDNRLPDPFVADSSTWGAGHNMKEGGDLDRTLHKVFAVHLHNQWNKAFPTGGWVDRLLLRRYEVTLGDS